MDLFLDLDGVLADFKKGVERVTGRRPDQQSTREMWQALAREPEFFATLAMMADAHALWQFCRPYRPVILTGLPLGDWAAAQKRRWVGNMLGADIEVITCMSRDKPIYAGPDKVLVDDRPKIRDGWKERGGIFILHTGAETSIAALRRLGFT